ncbi:MAG TPA: hypothetical protein VG944_17485, partial [Fimbriimonas sp.]|nr:hypothetical protein [Fimbriimonas sp.]
AMKRSTIRPWWLWLVPLTVVCYAPSHHGASSNNGLPNFIFFTSTKDGNEEIYQWDKSTQLVTNLTNDPGEDYNAATTPGWNKVVFSSTRGGGGAHIFSMDPDGHNVVQLTTGTDTDELATIDPSSHKIAFARTSGGLQTLWTMDSDGSNLEQITTDEGYDPCFTSGGQILFCSGRTGNSELWICDADGSNATQITHTANVDEYVPTIAPDGSKVYVGAQAAGGSQSILSVDTSNGTEKVEADSGGQFKDWPHVTSNGTLLFSLQSVEDAEDGTIHYQRPNGGGHDNQVPNIPSKSLDPTSL